MVAADGWTTWALADRMPATRVKMGWDMAGAGTWLRTRMRLSWWFWLLFMLPLAILTFTLGFFVGNPGSPGTRALEACVLAVVGALGARLFIGWLVGPPREETGSDEARRLWLFLAFFLSPVVLVIEIIPWIVRRPFLTSATGLVWMATVIGGFTGFMDGAYRIHRASVAFPFPFDVTWGLSGTTNAVSVHIVNAFIGQHRLAPTAIAPETRQDAHQYDVGFAIQPTAAFTQGNVMSNMGGGLDSVFWHELAHVYQNRLFGPWFTLGYVEWLAAALLPGLFVGLVSGNGGDAGSGIYAWAYADNPYERVGYAIGGNPGTPAHLTWEAGMWVIASLPFYLHGVMLIIRGAYRLWWARDVFRIWNILEPLRGFTPAIIAMGNLTIWTVLAGDVGAVIGWILAIIGWLSCFLPVASDPFTANIGTRIYKAVLGWASWLMPMCWPCHALGLVMFLINLIGIRAFRCHYQAGSFQSIGGILGRLCSPGRGFTIGGFSVLNIDRLTRPSMFHEGGHALNHAAYGFLHLGHILRFAGRRTTFIAMAESHVPHGLRRSDAYDQGDDWPRLRIWGPGLTQH